jgi:hypothetical protein
MDDALSIQSVYDVEEAQRLKEVHLVRRAYGFE